MLRTLRFQVSNASPWTHGLPSVAPSNPLRFGAKDAAWGGNRSSFADSVLGFGGQNPMTLRPSVFELKNSSDS